MKEADYSIAALRASMARALWLRAAVWLGAGYALAWGVAVLIARGAAGASRADLAWGAAGLAAVAVAAGVWAVRRLPPAAALRAVVDRYGRAGGLVMAAGEADVTAWQDRVVPAAEATPRLAWRDGRAWVLLAAASAFVAAAFAVPDWWVVPVPRVPLDIEQPAGQLQQQIETLAQERILDDDKAAVMREQLEQVKKAALGADPIKTWEALDHLQDTVDQAAKSAAEQALRQAEAMAGAEQLAEAVMQTVEARDPEALAEAMREAAERMQQAMAGDAMLRDALPEAMRQLAESGAMTPGDMAALAQRMAEMGLERPELAAALKKATGLGQLGQNMDPELAAELARELARLMEELLREHPELAERLGEQLAGACQGGQALSPEQMQALLDALRDGRLDLQRMLEAMREAKLADPEALRQMAELGEIDPQALLDFLNGECAGGQCNAGSMASALSQRPGRGGINRGRGDAPMIHGDESTPDGVTFKEKVLPPATVRAMKDSQMLGVTQDAPEVDTEAPASAGGALDGAAAGGGSAVKHPTLPRHQGAVRRYFDREQP